MINAIAGVILLMVLCLLLGGKKCGETSTPTTMHKEVDNA